MSKQKMTGERLEFMQDLKALDDIRLGMIWPRNSIKDAAKVRTYCQQQGWCRVEDENHPCGKPVTYLTTKGLRALSRVLGDQSD